MAFEDESQRKAFRAHLAERATTLAAIAQRTVTFWEAAAVLLDGLNTVLEVDFEESELSPAELSLARQIEAEKYGSEAWTRRVTRTVQLA